MTDGQHDGPSRGAATAAVALTVLGGLLTLFATGGALALLWLT